MGTIDELSSFLGMAKRLIKNKKDKSILERIQNDLFIVGRQIFGLDSRKPKQKTSSQSIRYLENTIKKLEDKIRKLEKQYPFSNFVLAGDNLPSAVLHASRTVARRLERRAVALRNKRGLKDEDILVYLDKLSDLLFSLACRYNSKNLRRC